MRGKYRRNKSPNSILTIETGDSDVTAWYRYNPTINTVVMSLRNEAWSQRWKPMAVKSPICYVCIKEGYIVSILFVMYLLYTFSLHVSHQFLSECIMKNGRRKVWMVKQLWRPHHALTSYFKHKGRMNVTPRLFIEYCVKYVNVYLRSAVDFLNTSKVFLVYAMET
jgi:hypothetical protein